MTLGLIVSIFITFLLLPSLLSSFSSELKSMDREENPS